MCWTRRPGQGGGRHRRDHVRVRVEVGRPRDPRDTEARADGAVRGRGEEPRRVVPIVHGVQGAEDPVHVPRPGRVEARLVDREAPRRLEFGVDPAGRAALRADRIRGPGGVVHGIGAVVLEGAGEDLRRLRLEAHRTHVDGRRERKEGSFPERGDRSVIGAGRTAVRRRRGPTESPCEIVVVVVLRTVEVHLHRVADGASWYELSQADRAADRREHGAAVTSGVAGPEQALVLLRPPHRDVSVFSATRHRLALDQRVVVGGQDRGRIVRRRAVRIAGARAGDDEIGRDGRREEDAALDVASAAAAPGIAVVVDRCDGSTRCQDEDVDIRRHSVVRGFLDAGGDVDRARADREIPDAVPREGPRMRIPNDVRRRGGVGLHGRVDGQRERSAPVATRRRSADPEGHGAEDDQPDQRDRKGERPASAARCNAQRRANAGGPV